MPLLNKLNYDKIPPWRDATLFLIICEGEKREFQYFEFFDKIDRKLKIISVPSEKGESAPKYLEVNAEKAVKKYVSDGGDFELWFVLDLEWPQNDILTIYNLCKTKVNWFTALSNPCFEVWLYYHFENKAPATDSLDQAKTWKRLIPRIHEGGFDSKRHPTLIRNAIEITKSNYSGEGYLPNVGTTQLFRLGEKIYALTKQTLEKYY